MATKNALASALDSIKSGAVKFAGQTPIGQLVTKMGQVSQPLRVPSMGELTNSYNQAVGGVSSFVQQNPSPASFVMRQVPQIKQAPLRINFSQAAKTFQENMRLLSHPVQSLTTETPAARFLMQNVYTPMEYSQGISGGVSPDVTPTVGKFLAGTTEDVLNAMIPMYPMLSGPAQLTRNILKEGPNVAAMLRSGAVMTAFSAGLRSLKGEKVTPGDLASSFGIGALFGIAEPKPLPGLATTELGAARDVLGKYGFKLEDYSSSALLKAKFRRAVMDLHPDKGGNPEEFKAFMDAYNKTTSAGIDPAWKFPDIMAWIRNLWTKKQQPTTQGLKLAPQSVVQGTATQQIFGKIADVVRTQSGEGAHIFEGPQIRTVLKQAGLDTLPEGTIDAPGFVIQYMRKDPVTGQPIVPRLVVNIMPQEAVQPSAPVAPQVQAPMVAPATSITPPTVTTGVQAPIPTVVAPKVPAPYESLAPSSIDYIREMRRLVNNDELKKMTKMDNKGINDYVASQPPSTGGKIPKGGVVQPQVPGSTLVGITSAQQASPITSKIITEGNALFNAGKIDEGLSKLQEATAATLPELQGLLASDGSTQILNLDTNTHGLYFGVPEPSYMLSITSNDFNKTLGSFAVFAKHHGQDSFIMGTSSVSPEATPGVVLNFNRSLTNQEVLNIEKIFNDGGIGLTLDQKTGNGYSLNIKQLDNLTPEQWTPIAKKILLELKNKGLIPSFILDNYDAKVYTKDKYDALIKSASQQETALKPGVSPTSQPGIAGGGISIRPQSQVETRGNVSPLLQENSQVSQTVTPPSVQPVVTPQVLPSTPPSPVPMGMIRVGQPSKKPPSETPKVDFTANDIELYNRLIKFLGTDMFKETYNLGYKGGSYMMKRLDVFGKPADTISPEALQTVIDQIKAGKGYQPSLAIETSKDRFTILSHPETYFALQKLGFHFLPFIDVTGQKGTTASWAEGDYHYNTDPYDRWNSAYPGSAYAPPQQPPPPPPKPIADILEQAKQQKIAKEAQPKFFNLLDKIKYQVLGDLHPAALLDSLVGKAGGLTQYEAQLILNRGRIRGTQDEQSQLFKNNLTSSGMVDFRGNIDPNLEIFIRANQYIYRETVLTKRVQAMMRDKNADVQQKGKDLMNDIKQSRINEGYQTIESAKIEIKNLENKVGTERFNQIQSAATKIWDQLKEAFTAKYKAGLVKESTYKEVMSRDQGYVPYAVLQYEKATKDGGIRADGKPVRTMWGTTEIQDNPIKSAYYAIINAQSLVYTNIANRELYKAIKFVPQWVRPGRTGEKPPDGFTALNVYSKGIKKTIYVPNEIAGMYEYTPMSDKTLSKFIRYTLGATKGAFVWFVTGVRPVFTLVNKIGDVMRLATWSKAGVTLTNPVATTIFVADVINGVVQSMVSELPSGRWVTPRIKALKARGVLASTFTESLADFGPDYSLGFKMPGFGTKALDFTNQLLLYINFVAEKSTKVTSDIRLERMGLDQITRDVESKQYGGSPDFQQLGNLIRRAYLNRVFVFINPAIQGPRLDIRRTAEGGWKGNAESKKARFRIITNIVLPAILVYYLQQLPDWKKDYDELKKNNQLLFENNWVVPVPFKGTRADGSYGWKYVLIPLRDTQQNINMLTDGLLDIMRERTPEVFQNSLYKAIMTWSPFRTQVSNIGQAKGFLGKVGTVAKDTAFGVMSALNPMLRALPEQLGNIKFYSRTPIVSAYLTNKLPPDQWTPTTPSVYKMLGERFGMSPVRIQYGIEQFGGSVPSDFLRMFGVALPSMSDEEKYLSDPIIRRFVGVVTSGREADVERFFTATNQVAQTYQSYLFRAKSQADMAQAQAFLDAHPELMYRKAIASMAARMNDVYGSERKVRYNTTLSDQDKRAMIAQLETQKQGVLDTFNQIWDQFNAAKTGKPAQPTQSLIPQARAAETTPTSTPITGRITNFYNQVTGKTTPITFSNPSQTGTGTQQMPQISTTPSSSISDLLKTTSKYSDARSFFDMALQNGQPFDSARQMAQTQGLDPNLAEYDFWTAQNARVRTLHVQEATRGLTGNDLWNTLVDFRTESPGTGNMILSDTLVTELVNNGTITKNMGTQLKKIKTQLDANGQPIPNTDVTPLSTSTGTSTKASTTVTKISTLLKQRSTAYQKALKVKTSAKSSGIKIKLPKPVVFKPLKATTTKAPIFRLKLPKIKPIQIPARLGGLIHATSTPKLY